MMTNANRDETHLLPLRHNGVEIAGEFFSGSLNAFLRLLLLFPAILLMILGRLIKKKNGPVSFATARAMSILPVLGRPNNKIPPGGLILIDLKGGGQRNGSLTSLQI